MNEYLKTVNARLKLAQQSLNTDMIGLAISIYQDVTNDLIDMIKTLNTHIETMREIMKGE